jgi:hypothetical protein
MAEEEKLRKSSHWHPPLRSAMDVFNSDLAPVSSETVVRKYPVL